ncbi:MAG: hypothetical protein WCV55_03040 [Candidatus Paceibacterota bacterium]
MFSLLPEKYRKRLHFEYRIRLAIVGLLGLIILTIISGIFILPTYLRVSVENKISLDQKNSLEKQIALQAGQSGADDIKSIRQNINIAAVDQRSVISSIKAVIKAQSSEIKLTNFSYIYNSKASTLVISGIASSRQSLQTFQKKLLEQTLFTNANLPLSNYAKDSNIPFSINLSGQF